MDIKKTKEPAIRFKGFTGNWEQRKLGNVAPLQRGFDLPKESMSSGEFPVVMSNGINGYHNEYKIKGPGVVTGRSGTIGNVHYIEKDYWPHNTTLWVTDFKGNNQTFIFFLYQQLDLSRFGTGSGVPTLNRNDVHTEVISMPNFEEQANIAEYFLCLDHLITLHQRELDLMKQQKKSLLSKMFPKNGAEFPELRFIGYTNPWEQRKLSDIATFINGRAYKQQELLEFGKYPVLRVGNFGTNNQWYYSDLELDDKFYANNGDLLYTWATAFGPHIWDGKKVIYHYHIWKIELSEHLDRDYALQLLESDKAKLLANTNGSTMIHVTKNEMESKMVSVSSIEEQRLIGIFLKELDHLITLHQRKLETLKSIKKSFLAKMFV
ncbi:restriction endonuclease subunit S [Lachnospiraceae bacterium OttesenSCG-928-J05]|nr:restriction endonuclease subunit S [Lachnospiraceae bacterium OttesenSCG-928-J05]